MALVVVRFDLPVSLSEAEMLSGTTNEDNLVNARFVDLGSLRTF